MLVAGCARFSMDDHVSGHDLGDAFFDAVGELVDLFEIGGAGDADSGIHEIAIACAAKADAIRVEDAIEAADGSHDFFLKAGGGGVEQSIQRPAAELRTDPKDHTGDGEAGQRVSVIQPGKIPSIAGPNERDAEDDDYGAPNISGEVEGVGFEGFAGVALGDRVECTRPRQINGEGDKKNEDGDEAGLNVNAVKEEAVESFVNDVDGGEDEQAGFDECGEIFKFTVAVGMALVGGLIGDTNGEKGDDGGDQVEAGMEGFGEDAETVRAEDQEGFEAEEEGSGADTQQSGALLFLDGSMEASGKDHEVRLQQVGEIRDSWPVTQRGWRRSASNSPLANSARGAPG